jgi:hypothetical protein
MKPCRPFFRVLWLCGLAALAAASGLRAQANGTAPARTELRFMSWEVDQTGLFVTENGRDYTAISAPAYDLGSPVMVRAGAPVRVYVRAAGADGVDYAVAGETTLPADCRAAQVYLIRGPDRDGRRDYRLIALSNDAEAFSAGKVRLFNFSPWPAAIRINGEGATLASLEWRIVDATPDRKNRVPLQAALQLPDGGWTPAVRDLVTLRENYRGSVTLLHTRRSLDAADTESVSSQARMFIQTSSEYLNPEKEDNNR